MRKRAAGAGLSFVPPMLPTLVEDAPEGKGWIHEVKYDGYRTQIVLQDGRTTVYTRNGYDWTDKFAAVAEAAAALPAQSAIIDGEMVVLDAGGRSNFHRLKTSIKSNPDALVFVAFDLLHLDGRDLRDEPLLERRAALWRLVAPGEGKIQYSQHVDIDGPSFFAAADRIGLEGIVSKRADSGYRSGRTRAWLKIKSYQESELEVAGILREPGEVALALMVSPGDRRYVGSAIVSLTESMRERLYKRVSEKSGPPPKDVKKPKAKWTAPGLVGKVRHLRGEEMLRHATLQEISERRR